MATTSPLPPLELPAPPIRDFAISGLHCAGCAQSVQTGVQRLDGVEGCSLDFTSARLRVEGEVDPTAVLERVQALGYQGEALAPGQLASSWGEGESETADPDGEARPDSLLGYLLKQREARPALLGAILLLPGLLFHEILGWEAQWIELPALLALVVAGRPVLQSAWRGLRINRELNIQALMTIAAVGALVIGAWVEAGMVVVLFSIGETLEGYAAARARNAIRSLMTVAPPRAVLLKGAERKVVPVETLVPGDVILVVPGERIPMDGVIRAGSTTVDTSALTGESLPRDRDPGDEVLAGSVNGDGALEVEVTRPSSDTALHRMVRLMEEAQSQKVPIQRFIDRFARVYTPAVVALAVAVAVLPPVLLGAPFWNPDPQTFGWFYRSLALLVVACPCALVISVPASVVSALTNAAHSGMLIKGGAHLECLARVRAVAFDKTGTLTEGALTVVGVRSVDCREPEDSGECREPLGTGPCASCDDLLALAAAVEQRSEHPVGRAVAQAARNRLSSHQIPEATDHRALSGRGITALLAGKSVTIGSHRHFDLHIPHDGQHCDDARADAQEGRIPILVEMEGRFLGTITLSDVPRPHSREAVSALKEMGVTPVLLSGDSGPAARHLAERVGIQEVRADLMPAEKMTAIEELQLEWGCVAMVGDGINDAPALAKADVGIAVGGDLGGTDQARQAAAMTLLRGDLRLLPRTIRLARAAMTTVRLNVGFAVGIKAVFLALILAGMGTLWMAVLADVGATVLVTLFGMRLLRWKEPQPAPA
ncbi:MAG: cation-translocating P-type ATPase [Gemmatimonadota bacterium]